jgi:hypothetical protein
MKATKIRVLPNPYAAIDADGVPQGVVGMPLTRGVWVGARLDLEASEKTGKSRFVFVDREVELPLIAETARAVLAGSLIAADEASAKACGVKEFIAPPEALAREKQRAEEQFRASYGDAAELKPVPYFKAAPAPAAEVPPEPETKPEGRKVPSPGLVSLSPTIQLDKREEA